MLKLIADSGSTKTDWVLTGGGKRQVFATQGINPFHQKKEVIAQVLIDELLAQHELLAQEVGEIYFYGSGCTPESSVVVDELLHQYFPHVKVTEVSSDLLGAARALLGHRSGVACILGTGANSCLYDGQNIVQNTPPLGYILGDEGSGAVLGKMFLHHLYKGMLPHEMVADFEQWASMSYGDVIRRVYREPMANRFMASLVKYVAEHIDQECMCELVKNNFDQFFDNNLSQYEASLTSNREVGFVGGVAWQFRDILAQVAEKHGYQVSLITKSPIDELEKFHR